MIGEPPRREPEPEVLVELRRDGRGRLRRLRLLPPRGRPEPPLWARIGLAAPLRPTWTLVIVACACALAGGAVIAAIALPGLVR